MTRTIHLEPRLVPAALRGAYAGKSFKAHVCESVTIPMTAGLWDGGSRDTYTIVRLGDNAALSGSDNMSAPWDKTRQDREITLTPGIAVVEHSIFCGKDHGLTFYLHPDNAAKLLPAPVEITAIEKAVLNIITGIKSAYRADEYRRARITPDQVTLAKGRLFDLGLINKAGAVTIQGRNAR